MTTPVASQTLGVPYALAEPSVQHSARLDRLAMGASFRPSTAALGATSGILYGPAGGMGELTLVNDATARVNPFVAVIQGTHNTRQGQYVVPNEEQRDLAVVAKDASLFRRSLIVVRVADSVEAAVAATAATNGAWLERIDGPLAASNPALPTGLPENLLALGELSIPSVASGQPVTLTPYNPRTGLRGAILPVFADSSTVPGHGSAPGSYVGEYRDHPARGLQRWDGAWRAAVPRRAAAKVQATAVTNVVAGNGTLGAWNTAPMYDTDGLWDGANRRFIIPWAGEWRSKMRTIWTGGTNDTIVVCRILRGPANNTSPNNANASDMRLSRVSETYVTPEWEGTCAAGDALYAQFYISAGMNFQATHLGQAAYWYLEYLGPTP